MAASMTVNSQRLDDLCRGVTVQRSPHWGAVRRAVLKAHPYCAACGSAWWLAVHHIKAFHLFPELELVAENLIVLCEPPFLFKHHLKIGHTVGGKSSWKINNPDVVADSALALLGVTRP